MYKLVDKETDEVIGTVVSNQSLSFDDVCRLVGLVWHEYPDLPDPNWYTGWYTSSGEYVNEETAEVQSG